MSVYTTPEFLNDGSVNHNYEDLSYHEKLKIKALEGLENLAANLNAIANYKADQAALETQIADLQAQNVELQAKFNQLKTVLTSIDQMTDEVID